jgi:hypothetical protein
MSTGFWSTSTMTHESYDLPTSSIAPPVIDPTNVPFEIETADLSTDNRWRESNPAGVIELTDRELREAMSERPLPGSVATTWCFIGPPKVC